MRNYELVCIFQPELDETAFKGAVERVSNWVTEAGGNVDKLEVWGRRRLAYVIHDPKAASGLERNIRYLETVMRHMLTAM